jgi:hypothetical protein
LNQASPKYKSSVTARPTFWVSSCVLINISILHYMTASVV